MHDGPAELTLVTWNLHGSAGPDLALVASELRRWAPIAVGLQEVRRSQARRLAAMLGWNVVWVFKHFPLTPLVWWRAEGMAILSPHSLRGTGRVALTPGIRSWSHRRRVAHWATIDAAAGPLRLVNVHLAAHRDGRADRVSQASIVAGLVGPDTVLTGDLNASREPDVLAPLEAAGLQDTWAGPGPGDTNPAGRVSQRLDYVLAGPAFVPASGQIPEDGPSWAALSDHLPVIAGILRRPIS